MSKTLKPITEAANAVREVAAQSQAGMDDDLKAVERQLAAEDGLTIDGDDNTKTGSDVVYDATVASKPESEMTDAELTAAQEALKKRETTIGTKTTQNGAISIENADGKRFDSVGSGKSKEVAELGGTITGTEDGKIKYKGELGDFTYDPDDWALGTKEVKDEASGVTTTIPVLRYINEDNSSKWGDQVYGGNIEIPDGLKRLDYSFENNKALETIPRIPDSVESAHAAFKNCTKAERAANNAKDDEHDGVKQQAGGTAAGLAGTVASGCAVYGACNGWNPTGWIALGVAGVTSAGVGIYNVVAGAENDGKGGTWNMPDGLKDASEMFSGCKNLTEAYESAGKNLINARSMYAGTKKLGTDEVANKFGSVAITDFNSDSKLSKEAVQGSYTGTNVELTKDLKGNYSKDWDEETQTMNKADITAEEKKEVEDLNRTLQEHDAVYGEVQNDMTVQTDGLASSAVKKTEHGYQSTTNVNDKNVKSAYSDSMDLVDRGLVSLGEFWILKKITGNMLVAGVATFGLQAVGVLPKSMKPILNAVTGFVGEDSMIGQALSKISDKLPDEETTTVNAASKDTAVDKKEARQDKKEKDSSDKTNSTVDERVKSDMNSLKVAATSDKVIDVSKAMEANGHQVVKDGVLLTAANKASNDQEFEDIKTMSMTMAAGLEEKATSMAGESGKLSDEDKKTLAAQCMNVMNSIDAYDNGALAQIKTQYGENNEKSDKAKLGLSQTMYVAATPLMDAVKDMDSKYNFLSKEDKEKLSKMEITGVTKYDDYQIGDIDQPLPSSEPSVETTEVQPNVVSGGAIGFDDTEDMSMYANAGLNDELDLSSKVASDNITLTSVPKIGVESRSLTSNNKVTAVPTKGDRGAEAEAKFGGIVSQESESNADYDMF